MERAPVPEPVKRPIVPPLVKNLEFKIGLLLAFTVLLVGAFVLYALYARGAFQITQNLILTAPDAPLPPQVTLQARPASVVYEGSTTLGWSSANADSCAASGDWAGNKALNGSEATGSLTSNRTYTLTCSNSMGQTAVATVAVTVGPPPVPAPAPSRTVTGGPIG